MNTKYLEELCKIIIGRTPSRKISEYWGAGFPWVTISDMKEKYINCTKEEITQNAIEKVKCRLIPSGTLLFSFKLSIGKMAFAARDLYTNEAIAALIIEKPKELFPDYLYYALKATKLSGSNQAAKGKTLNSQSLALLEIPYTENVNDQIRIATLLNRVEALIATRKENLRLLDEFLKSTFLEMFGDPVQNEKGFETKSLSEFYIDPKNGTKCGPFGSALKKEEYVKSGVPVWNMDNITIDGRFNPEIGLWITDKKFEELKAYSAVNGDVIISRAGTVGKMCVLSSKYAKSIISTNLIRVRFGKGLLPMFFVSLMTYFKGRVGNLRTGADGSFTHMNTGILDKIQFPYPPIKMQVQYASVVEKTETLRAAYQNNLLELKNLYGALSQKAFKGELDLSRIPLEKELELQIDVNERVSVSDAPLFGPLNQGTMSDLVARKRLIQGIVEEYFSGQPRRFFSFKDFWPRVELKVQDHMDEESPPLGITDYNLVREWVFEHLKSGQIEQFFNEDENQMELRTKQ